MGILLSCACLMESDISCIWSRQWIYNLHLAHPVIEWIIVSEAGENYFSNHHFCLCFLGNHSSFFLSGKNAKGEDVAISQGIARGKIIQPLARRKEINTINQRFLSICLLPLALRKPRTRAIDRDLLMRPDHPAKACQNTETYKRS